MITPILEADWIIFHFNFFTKKKLSFRLKNFNYILIYFF